MRSAVPPPARASMAAIASLVHAPSGWRSTIPPAAPTPRARCAANGVATSATAKVRTRAGIAPRAPEPALSSCNRRTPAAIPAATGPITRSAVNPDSGCTMASIASALAPRATATVAAAESTTPVAASIDGSRPASANFAPSGTKRSPEGPTGSKRATAWAPSAS